MDLHTIDRKVLAGGSQAWDGSQLPDYPDGEPEISIMRITIPAGDRLEMHVHPVINAGMVISGTLTVISASGDEHEFKAGDAIIEMVGKPHYGENRGDEPVDIVMFYASTPGTPLSLPYTATTDGESADTVVANILEATVC